MKLFPIGDEKKDVGWITSATHSRKIGNEIGLGFMRRPFFHSSYRLDAINPDNPLASGPVRVEIADLPFPRANTGT
jgi:glycine cleavage system aminomethyltransferase T